MMSCVAQEAVLMVTIADEATGCGPSVVTAVHSSSHDRISNPSRSDNLLSAQNEGQLPRIVLR